MGVWSAYLRRQKDPCLKGREFKQGRTVQERPSPVGDAARTGDARVLANANTSRLGRADPPAALVHCASRNRFFSVPDKSAFLDPLWARQGRRHFILV